MKIPALAFCIGVVVFASANAQEYSHITADFGGGFTNPVGSSGHYLDNGWNIRGGVGFNLSSVLGANLNLGYDSMGINGATLANIGVPGGDVHIFHATIDPVLHLTGQRRFDVYVTAGGGIFHRTQQFTAPTIVTTTAFVPFFGFYPVAFGATQILSSYSVTRPGFDAGAGVAFGAFGHGKFFAEARWDRMFMNGGDTDFIPVTFGFRW